MRAFLTLVGKHSKLIEEREPEGRLERSLKRDNKLRAALEKAKLEDGTYQIAGDLLNSFQRAFIKTVQGLFFGLYGRLTNSSELELLHISHVDQGSPEEAIATFQPNILEDISDEPLSEISPSSWHSRRPVLLVESPSPDGQILRHVFRLKRETKLRWESIQEGIFRFATFEHEDGRLVCVIELWGSLIVQVATPWPAAAGPLRRVRRKSN